MITVRYNVNTLKVVRRKSSDDDESVKQKTITNTWIVANIQHATLSIRHDYIIKVIKKTIRNGK